MASSDRRRVVVTGVGLVSPIGIGTRETWEALLAGRNGVGPITHFDASAFGSRIAAEVDDFDPERWIEKKELKKSDRFIHFAIAAAQMAVDDAGLEITESEAERVGVDIGSGIGGLPLIERTHTDRKSVV